MNIHIDPPRHIGDIDHPEADEICYRAILKGDCPLSHSYEHRPITRDEEAQLNWIREQITHEKQTPRLGDLVDAEYVDGIGGAVRLLRGIVIGIGEWEGTPTYSVAGFDAFDEPATTSSSTMPVHMVASRDTEAARAMMRDRIARSSGFIREKLIRISTEEMGM